MLIATNPPLLYPVPLEPTERRRIRISFSRLLLEDILTLQSVDPEGVVADLEAIGQTVVTTLIAVTPGTVALVTITVATASGQTERQLLSVATVDPAATIEEINP